MKIKVVKVETMTLAQYSQQTDVTIGVMLAKLEEHEQRLAKLEQRNTELLSGMTDTGKGKAK